MDEADSKIYEACKKACLRMPNWIIRSIWKPFFVAQRGFVPVSKLDRFDLRMSLFSATKAGFFRSGTCMEKGTQRVCSGTAGKIRLVIGLQKGGIYVTDQKPDNYTQKRFTSDFTGFFLCIQCR